MAVSAAVRRLILTLEPAERARAELERIDGIEVVASYELARTRDPNVLAAGLDGAWATVAGVEPYTRSVFEAVPGLKAVFRWGTGSDAIDIPAATEAGVAVITTPGVNAEAVADMALALMLACIRRLPALDQAVRTASWRPDGPSRDLAGATVGVVGLGAIGRAVTRRLRGFGCHVLALEPYPDEDFCAEYDVELTNLESMLPRVDVLTLHAPANATSRGLIGAPELHALQSHAVLINTARGDLVDQGALAAALRGGEIAAAGLDVFEHEPVAPDDPILAAPNTIVSGHISSYTELGLERTKQALIANVQAVLAGRLPPSCLNPKAWAT
ncbi:MAG TPA: NAD(P)-dependent oxidoreductase [Solirubrobacteraceae bacterium]|nr:NAD(P)-dependent oxidoreductase [Solirubrobacteraceae bacterium]